MLNILFTVLFLLNEQVAYVRVETPAYANVVGCVAIDRDAQWALWECPVNEHDTEGKEPYPVKVEIPANKCGMTGITIAGYRGDGILVREQHASLRVSCLYMPTVKRP